MYRGLLVLNSKIFEMSFNRQDYEGFCVIRRWHHNLYKIVLRFLKASFMLFVKLGIIIRSEDEFLKYSPLRAF